jgi:NOL1/NOP2/fmu family ribosome biogenesis protein
MEDSNKKKFRRINRWKIVTMIEKGQRMEVVELSEYEFKKYFSNNVVRRLRRKK